MSVNVERLGTAKPTREFIDLPYALYDGDHNWVPPLRADERNKLDSSQHPFWAHAERELFIARRTSPKVGEPGDRDGRAARSDASSPSSTGSGRKHTTRRPPIGAGSSAPTTARRRRRSSTRRRPGPRIRAALASSAR